MNKIHISDFVYQYLSDLRIEKDQEAHIRLFAERTGEQVGQIITDIVAESMALILAGKSTTAAQLPLSAPLSVGVLLTAKEVASYLSISKAKAYRMMQDKEIPTFRIGRTARVRAHDLEIFIKEHVL